MERRPTGYVGIGHETIGSDILAVVHALGHLSERRTDVLTAQVLGHGAAARLAGVRAEQWYPIDLLLETLETLEQKLGNYGLRQVGRTLFKLTHQERVVRVARSGRDIIEGIDGMYRHANRGDRIGGWRVVSFDVHRAELEKTTPHHCAMEEGILSEALAAVGSPAVVSQPLCFRRGAPACVYRITPAVGDARWTGVAASTPSGGLPRVPAGAAERSVTPDARRASPPRTDARERTAPPPHPSRARNPG